mgnify:CR=1 FL=1
MSKPLAAALRPEKLDDVCGQQHLLNKDAVFRRAIENGVIQNMIAKEMKLSNKDILPMFIIGDTFYRVVFVSQGYTIGLGEQMMKVIHKL